MYECCSRPDGATAAVAAAAASAAVLTVVAVCEAPRAGGPGNRPGDDRARIDTC